MASNNQVVITLSAKDDASRVFSGLNRTIEGSVLKANLLAQAIGGGLTSAVSALNNKFKEAANLQLNNITAASTYAALTGRAFGDAEQVISKINDRLAEAAASLPGNTQAYKDIALGIQDNLIPAFVDANGVFNEGAFLDGLTDITKGLGVLGAASQVASKDVSKFTAKFLGGSSISQLRQLLFAEANPAFLALVEKKLAESGKKLEQLTVKERAEILRAVQAQLVTPETIRAASNSVGGLIEGLKSSLFEPTKGVFGLLRDLDKNTKGEQSVLTAINEGLIAVLGEDGLLSNIGKSLKLLGISFGDPLVPIRNGILSFNKKIEEFNSFLKEFNINMDANLLKNRVIAFFSKIINFEGLGTKLAKVLNQGLEFLGGLDWSLIFGFVGVKLAELFNELFKFILKLDFNKLLDIVLNMVGGLFIGLGKFLSTLDWGALLLSVGKLLGYGLLGAVAVAVGIMVAPVVASIGSLGLAIAAAWTGLVAVVASNWDKLTSLIFNSFHQLQRDLTSVREAVASAVINFFQGIANWFLELTSKIPGFNLQAKEGLSSGITNGVSQYVPNSANGRVDGLLAAAIRESKAAPSGAGLVVANTSEAILNRQQQAALISSLNNRGGGLTIGSITIQTQATDAKGIAKDIMNHIAYEFNNFSQGYVTAPVL